MLHEIAQLNFPVITLEEAAIQGSFGSAVLEFFHDHNYHGVEVKRMGIPDRFIEHGNVSQLLEEVGLTSSRLIEEVNEMLPRKRQRA